MNGSLLTDLNLWRYTFLRNRPIFMAHSTSTQSIPNSTWTTITLPTVDVDNYGAYNSGTSTWTAPCYGNYRISALVTFAANATPSRAISLLENSGGRVLTSNDNTPTSTGSTTCTILSQPLELSTGTTLVLQADQNSGAALSTVGSPYSSMWCIVWDRNF